jgi:predicted protein tyrosine phosphatase
MVSLKKMRHILFICRPDTSASSSAESTFAEQYGLEILFAELDNTAKVQLNPALVEWADIIFVMRKGDRDTLRKKFRKYLTRQHIIYLDTPDEYDSSNFDAIRILKDNLL